MKAQLSFTPRNSTTYGKLKAEIEVVSDYLHVGMEKGIPRVDSEKINNARKKIDNVLKDFINDRLSPGEVDQFFQPEVNWFSSENGTYFIPGNSVKGAVRSRIELSTPGSCYISTDRRTQNVSSRYISIFKPDKRIGSDNFLKEYFVNGRSICPVCNVFGNSGLASRVIFTDFKLVSGKVGIIPYNNERYEVVLKGSKFTGEILFKGLKDEEVGMVLFGMKAFDNAGKISFKEMLFGRFKFMDRKFGRVRFSIQSAVQINPLEDLKRFLEKYHPKEVNENW
ncbi:hypothetical protein CM19_04070 [Candidatus Acidianus copahuensis]|uniref:CRISPR type III-associated protein domain-containing protein n=1 Tax=Candidatus Acidianus copahuensis TaxID=1160895 RepID=A0A031LS36_9CREN|nr:RAMP superfamily CRISPR-associated protein [Candidatus Acidianus copahuensis]EZQ10606.1 hypothetical protein CM19_04070 [Candidatus Acidianus copahuensis]